MARRAAPLTTSAEGRLPTLLVLAGAEVQGPALEALLQTHALERQRWRDKVGLLSTCEALSAPGAVCNRPGDGAGRCALVPAGSGQR